MDFLRFIISLNFVFVLNLELVTSTNIDNTLVFNENEVRKEDKSATIKAIYPEFYDWETKARQNPDGVSSSSTLILKALNATHYVELSLNEDLNNVRVHFGEDLLEPDGTKNQCHFHGKIISKPTGSVAISTCSEDGKMSGLLMIGKRIYFLRPSSNESNPEDNNEHYLHEYSEEKSEFCGISNQESLVFGQEIEVKNQPENFIKSQRIKRGSLPPNKKVIELAIFIDFDLYKRIESTTVIDARRATVRRVLGIMNQVQLIFNYSSLQTKFKLVIVKFQILKSNQGVPDAANGDIDKYLDNFCGWQSKINGREGNHSHWDHAIMLTGRDLFKDANGKRNPKVLGLAWVSGMCRLNYSCTLNEGTSFEAAFVIAHEIAHNLGVMHDGSGNNCDRTKFIMSDKTGAGKVHWSACSNAYINQFFSNGNGACLSDDADPPNKSFDLNPRTLPGMRYSLSDQCILALGANYKPHKSNKEPFNNVCRELWCAAGAWAKPAHPALEGSPCDDGKLCLEGQCRSSALWRTSVTTKTTNTTTKIVSETPRNQEDSEPRGIFRKIQETVMNALKNLG